MKNRIAYSLPAIDGILLNLGFMLAFLLRYGGFPARIFTPYKESWLWLTLLYVAALAICGAYKHRFRSSWELFTKITVATTCGAAAGIVLMYVFREQWGAFPTGIFVIACPLHILAIFKINQWCLRQQKRIRKNVVVLGKGSIKGLVGKICVVHRTSPDEFKRLKADFKDIDQIILAEEIKDPELLEYLTLMTQRFRIDMVFTPVIYMKLIRRQVNGNDPQSFLRTFEGQQRDVEEFFIRLVDVAVAFAGLVFLSPALGLVALAVKCTSPGPVIFRQERSGKDSALFILYKFRTMVVDAEKATGPTLAQKKDPRITRIGTFLRQYRIDELPQLWNILQGTMSLVGPRPERPFFVKRHKALQGIRLAVKPGLTGLAQIRSFYDLEPRHKIRYDYLYIQRRSLRLNIYILINTIPALFTKTGW
jgi:exopolysaccharide biosynthesis polyprenyl glycosylphosphotransferase